MSSSPQLQVVRRENFALYDNPNEKKIIYLLRAFPK
jgi:hypothetical protein